MLFLSVAWTLSTGLSTEVEIPRLWDTSVPIISETSEGFQSGWADGMLPLPASQTYEDGLPPETGISMFWIGAVPVSCGTGAATVCFSIP